MSKHSDIRSVVLAALRERITDSGVTFSDGRPAFVDAQSLPTIAVYLTDAESLDDGYLDEETWQAILHVEVFLKASEPDTALDGWIEQRIKPVTNSIPALTALVESISVQGYDYQRDEEATTWGSADLKHVLTYQM
ncbi:phage minor tail U family protein [Dickeya dadantii]|uniref:phage minor tail U family protein n=1 Tax=Dickeya dadantii TaxID=204038 RepID=UPI001CF30B0E|nr:phage minor tail U family protein [Dickeya dadantii]MCA7012519.1 phage minor tail U family protein [Dickeya dadantii]